MEVVGTVILIGETQTFGEKGFRKRELVVKTDEKYPQEIPIEFIQDGTELLDAYLTGQLVKIAVNLRGRGWTNPQGEVKYFSSIQGWRIEAVEGEEKDESAPFETTTEIQKEEQGDLPF